MLEFHRLTLNDIGLMNSYFRMKENRTCDYTVGGTFMWRDFFSTEYAIKDDTLITKSSIHYMNYQNAFTIPLGKNIDGAYAEISSYCRDNDIPMIFSTVTEEDLPELESMFRCSKRLEPDWSDYLYNASDIIELKGRHYSGQRNHINAFMRENPDAVYEEINSSNLDEVLSFYKNSDLIDAKESAVFHEEQEKTIEVLENYDTYGLIGGLIRAGGKIAAFSAGEIIGDTLYDHIEKADTSFNGIYQVIACDFPKHAATPEVKYINREEDVGDEGLRRSKLSYRPCSILSKYTVNAYEK